jgi:hypothetical protein
MSEAVAENVVAEVKRGRGRPAGSDKFSDKQKKAIASVLKRHGLTAGHAHLMNEGVQLVPGKGKEKLTVSLPTLAKIAKSQGVEFQRGRPKAA